MKRLSLVVCFLAVVLSGLVKAGDWPTYQYDNARSGISNEQMEKPLNEVWAYTSRHAPQPAWPPPAKADYWHYLMEPRARAIYDRAYHVVSVKDAVYFSSSADDKVYCLDLSTGEERWTFFTEAPVRLAPTVWNSRIYFGSDDGCVYCLSATDGQLIWKYRAAPEDRRIPGNGRIISAWPVRTGVVVDDGIAYFCAGLFPNEGVYACALDAIDGTEVWKTKQDLSPQGYLLASEKRLYVPMGRVSPAILSRQEGKLLGILDCPRAEGGTYAILTGNALISGPGTQLTAFDAQENDRIATFNGYKMLVDKDTSYLLSEHELSAVDRSTRASVLERYNFFEDTREMLADKLMEIKEKRDKSSGEDPKALDREIDQITREISDLDRKMQEVRSKEYKWRKPCDRTYYSMILAGDTLFMGSEGVVEAISATDDEQVWSGEVQGKAYGLAAANGHLLVSTDRGTIHCFRHSRDTVTSRSQVKPSGAAFTYPSDKFAEVCASTAKRIIGETGISKGYCLVLGCENGRLAHELVKMTDLKIICIEEDASKVAKVRKALDETGIYGIRASVHHGNLASLPYTGYFANLVVSERMLNDGKLPGRASEVFRVLRPHGGVAYIGANRKLSRAELERWLGQDSVPGWEIVEKDGVWAILRRGALPNSGDWTHIYADAGNTTCSRDELTYGSTRVQWFGEPGPRPMLDRHHRASVPLFKDGRLFVPGDDRFITVDAYNGTIIWDVEVSRSRRVGANRDSGNMVATDDYLYITREDECLGLDVVTGRRVLEFEAPQPTPGSHYHWGYLAVVDDRLFGSGRKKEAIYNQTSRWADHELAWGDFKRMITSRYLFCMDRHTGEVIWNYKSGVIINPAIAIGGGRLYFVESSSPEALADDDGKIQLKVLLDDDNAELMALNLRSGEVDWKRPVDLSFSQHIIYLSYADDILLVTGSKNKDNNAHYYLQAFDARDGSTLWQNDHRNNVPGVGGDHGEQVHHPAIVNGVVYAEPVAYDLRTGVRVNTDGRKGDWTMPRRKGCGTVSASSHCLFYRDHQPSMYELRPNGGLTKLNHVTRVGCWINIIPAGGLILVPEASSGCTCSYPLQTSMAFVPDTASGSGVGR